MKKFIPAFLLLILGTKILLAQNIKLDKLPVEFSPELLTLKEVSHMAVFPGCEKINVNNKEALQKCLSKEINILLSKELEDFAYKLNKKGLTSAVAKLQFVIDKSGEIIQVKALVGDNIELGETSEKALNDIAQKIKKIQPALLEDGTPVNLVFQLPVKYVVQDSKINEFEWNEIVIATIVSENQKFEIRQGKNKNLKIYDIQVDKDIFLGNFKSYDEISSLEPYKTLLRSGGEKLLLVEKEIDSSLYRLYYSKIHKDYIEAYKVQNNTEDLIESLPLSNLEYSSLYLKLVLRK